jgi:hypothetical protein
VASTTRENYERGPLAALGGGPEAVAETIERAVSGAWPLHGHVLGEAIDFGAVASAGSGLGQPRGAILPAAGRVAEYDRSHIRFVRGEHENRGGAYMPRPGVFAR